MKYAYITIITNILAKLKKILQINTAVNGLYDTKLCGSNTVYLLPDHSLQCWSGVFLIYLSFVIIVSFCLHFYFTR